MIKDKILSLINNKDRYIIDKNILKYVKEMDLDINAFILLIYFINQKEKEIFDYKKIIEELNFNEKELLDAISSLKEKKLLTILMEKNESGILEEKIDVSSFYEIMVSKILNDNLNKENDNDLYDNFEKEFGRTLSPMEYDIINNWLESGIDKKLILEALKETVFNGVNNLRYVDKILYEWNKKGIKKREDVEIKTRKMEEEKEEDTYEYDWLNE